MSVVVSRRKESKFEAITYSVDLHNMLTDFVLRDFGVKDLKFIFTNITSNIVMMGGYCSVISRNFMTT